MTPDDDQRPPEFLTARGKAEWQKAALKRYRRRVDKLRWPPRKTDTNVERNT
jgi:hypothetical protein